MVPLPNVNAAILKKVITWATYHKVDQPGELRYNDFIFAFCFQDDPPPPEDDENKEKRTDDISTWDADFLKVTGVLL